jgi:two-component system, response regulator PdtaR
MHDRHTILLVDDQYLMRFVLAEVLQDCGFDVISACSGEEAIALLSKGCPIDVVLSDIESPRADCVELAKWVHQHKPDTPVVLTSGYGAAKAAVDMSGAQLLRRPYDFDAIVEQLHEIAASRYH